MAYIVPKSAPFFIMWRPSQTVPLSLSVRASMFCSETVFILIDMVNGFDRIGYYICMSGNSERSVSSSAFVSKCPPYSVFSPVGVKTVSQFPQSENIMSNMAKGFLWSFSFTCRAMFSPEGEVAISQRNPLCSKYPTG